MNGFVQHSSVSRSEDIAANGQRQPQVIVGATSANAAARGWMPPVLHVAFVKLARGAEQQVFTYKAWFGMDQRHHILQLVAKTDRASRLIEAAARPETAGKGLVHQPAIQQNVDGRIGCFDIHGAERVIPILPNGLECAASRCRSPKAMGQVPPPGAQREDNFSLLTFRKIKWNLDRS